MYQKPENYVRDLINSVIAKLGGEVKREEVTAEGFRMFVDYQYGKILIEAKAPGKRKYGRDQLLKYMEKLGFALGLLVDAPTEEYYREYPRPYRGRVGFELYLKGSLIYERAFEENEISYAEKELEFLLTVVNKLKVATLEPRPKIILQRIREIANRWEGKLMEIVKDASDERIKTYMSIWQRNMELLYGRDVLESVGENLTKLFIELTIYTAILKILGSTILESILGGGRYTIPLKLIQEGDKAAVELFWERRVLMKFNINYIFERDEYDWIFSPNIAGKISSFFKEVGEKLVEIDWSKPVGLDLLKKVYQNVVDVSLRRQLGEFYTPDWLAKLIIWRALHILAHGRPPRDFIINRIDDELTNLIDLIYSMEKRIPSFIDPTCGSFTFGVQYINALLGWYMKKKPNIHPIHFINEIIQNVVGIDLNPVAVITAKVNYLLQIYKLLMLYGNYLYEEPMIPIYRIDLVALHEMNRTKRRKGVDLTYYLHPENLSLTLYIPLTAVGVDVETINKLKNERLPIHHDRELGEYYLKLSIPKSIISKVSGNPAKLHRALIGLITNGVEGFENEVSSPLSSKERESLEQLTRAITVLEKHGFNNVWHSILVNHILALITADKKFDLVLGNLPWVNVSKYPEKVAKKLRKISKELGVNAPREAAKKLDISVILYAIATKYLAGNGGVIGLMVPTSIFRGLHGSGWRSFFLDEGLRIYEVFDLEDIQPFERAQNQPGIVFARKEG